MDQKVIVFDIFEVNYGNEDMSVIKDLRGKKHYFFVEDFETHTEAMIFLLNKAFDAGYDIVYNTNLDDFYDASRLYEQYLDLMENKNVMNSTLFTMVKDNRPDQSFVYRNNQFIWKPFAAASYDGDIPYEHIRQNLQQNHNVICHPGVCFTREFWNSYDQYGNKLRYRSDKPFEDLSLWRRAVDNHIRIGIVNKNLVWYRVHNNSVTRTAARLSRNHSLYNCFKDFAKAPDYSEFNLGFFIPFHDHTLEIIMDIETRVQPHRKKFYFLQVEAQYAEKLCDFSMKNGISKHIYITEDIHFDTVLEKYRSCIEMHTDYFYHLNHIHFDYVFYTCIYFIPKSKFDFQKYIEWGRNLLDFLKSYPIIIFTDKTTLDILRSELNLDHTNVRMVNKELQEMEYQCDDVFQRNTDKKYYPNHDIHFNLIKIWINRHLLVKEVQHMMYANYYCHIDFGYVRSPSTMSATFDSKMLCPNKICVGLIINNKKPLLDHIMHEIKDYDKIKIERTLIQNYYSIGGGCSIIPFSMIHYWISAFRSTFHTFLQKGIDFKDDQTILRQIVFDVQHQKHFQFISVPEDISIIQDHNNDPKWFPFLPFLQANESVEYHSMPPM